MSSTVISQNIDGGNSLPITLLGLNYWNAGYHPALFAVIDATAGLRDIKPLPEFSPFPLVLASAAAIAIGSVIGYWYLRRQQREATTQIAAEPIDVTALNRLSSLRAQYIAGSISTKEFVLGLSQQLRYYLELSLDFPACELTPGEVLLRLSQSLSNRFADVANAEQLNNLANECCLILRGCEHTAFAGKPSLPATLPPETLLESACGVIRQLRDWQIAGASKAVHAAPSGQTELTGELS